MSLPILRCALAGVLFATLARGQTDTIAPSVPSGVVASAVGVGGFSLAWNAATDNVAVARYEVFRGGVSLGTTTAVSFAVTGLAPNTAYAMRVRAGDAAGNWSAQSLALTVRTLPDTSAPSTPTGLAAGAVTATGFTLAWSASGDNVGVTLYEVFRNGASLGTTVALDKAVTKLSPLTAYTLTVRARDAAGNWSAQSAALSVTTAPDTTPPAAPAGLMASSVTATGLTLRWSVAADDVRTTAYEISRDGVSLGTTSALAKTLAGLSPLTTYRLTVRARDAAGNWSPLSAPLDLATTADTTAPSAPTGLAASAVTIAGFQLRWNAAADNVGATAYEVFRDGVSLGTTAGTTLAVTGLALSTSYSMTVRARDAAGTWSALSTPRVVTTLADTTPPSVPTGLVATAITLGSFTLTWSASADNVGVTAYEVFRGASSLGTTPGLSLDVTGLAPNIAYSMRVRARDAAGRWSAQSAPLVVRTLADTTPPTAPAGLAASGVTVTALTLTWAPAADDIGTTAYEVFRNGMSLGTTAAPTKAIVGLMPATDYTFTVRARDAAGNRSDLSVALVVTTLPDTTPPSVPAGLAASSVGVASFKLTWAAAADDVRTTGYEVFRDGTSVGVTLGLARNVSGLVPATAYALTVRARDAAGNWSAPSAPLTVTTLPDTTPPAVPAGLVASAIGTTGFTLRWSVPRDDVHTTAYEIFRDGVSLGTTTTGESPDGPRARHRLHDDGARQRRGRQLVRAQRAAGGEHARRHHATFRAGRGYG